MLFVDSVRNLRIGGAGYGARTAWILHGGIAFYGNVTVKSTDGPTHTTIDGGGETATVKIYSPGGTIEGFTITGGGGQPTDIGNGWGVLAGSWDYAGGTIRNNVITGNQRGGIGVDSGYVYVQVGVTIQGNVVTLNGLDPQLGSYHSRGIHVHVPQMSGPSGSVWVENNVVAFNGNPGTATGGGILIEACCPSSDPPSDVSVRVANNTVYANTATYGGGLAANASDLRLGNDIFFGNSAPTGSDLYLVQGALSAVVNSNVIGDGQFEGINGNIASDPLLTDPLTGDFELTGASPAIDSGDNAHCPPTDQRGRERPIDGNNDAVATCDVGSYEYCPGLPDSDGDLAGDACDGPGTGNVDCSGPATAAGGSAVDALKLLRYVAGLPVTQFEPCLNIGQPRDLLAPANWKMGDVDCDADVDAVDALKILRAIAGLPVSKPAVCPEIKPP